MRWFYFLNFWANSSYCQKATQALFSCKVFNITLTTADRLVFKNNTHRGSDFDPMSLSKRLSQEIFSSTFCDVLGTHISEL